MSLTRTHSIGTAPGDGIGPEVMSSGLPVLDLVADRHGFTLDWTEYPWGCDYFVETGHMMSADGLERLRQHDALLLGAVGRPDVPDHESLWGLLVPIRKELGLCVNYRPCRLLDGLSGPLSHAGDVDLHFVRENAEGEYVDIGGRLYRGRDELAIQGAVFTRHGMTAVMEYAFELAEQLGTGVVGATKSNGLMHSMPFWDQVFKEVAEQHPSVSATLMHADALAAMLVLRPADFGVVVASNLLGDLLSEVGAAVTGGIGMGPSANLDPGDTSPSLFEPIHGSAPDIAGRDVANPVGLLWSSSLMLRQLGELVAAADLMTALDAAVRNPATRTADLGGPLGTRAAAEAIADALPPARPSGSAGLEKGAQP